eukprot:TRINITY_DN25702_c0_g1_i1.p1 TRINITY_DN25702_c0_g1~~TRINITY_DN25702_c0_g1_i1.p1  ORF type:complete len:855 (+),score=156.63 TRINITY_DN25702_c0_g1_i1:62-2566(+)
MADGKPKEFPLRQVDGQHIEKITELYSCLNVECVDCAFACDYMVKCGLVLCRARDPISQAALRRKNHADPPSFLSPHSQVIEDSLLEFQKTVCFSPKHKNGRGYHLAVVLIAQEFRNWVNTFLSKLVSAEEKHLAEIKKRIELVYELQDTGSKMLEFAQWQEAINSVTRVLHDVQNAWPLYSVQDGLQASLKQTETVLRLVLYNLIMYVFHVMRGDRCGTTFSVMNYNTWPMDRDVKALHKSLSGRVMEALLFDPVIVECLGSTCASCAKSACNCPGFPQLDSFQGQQMLSAALGIEHHLPQSFAFDPWSGLVPVASSGLTSSATFEVAGTFGTGDAVDTYETAVLAWLRLHSRAAGVARTEKLVSAAHRLSSLGGDLLLAEYASKQRTHQLLTLVSKGLSVVNFDCEALERTLRKGINAQLKNQGLNWLNDSAFTQWHVNYQRAQQYRRDVTSCICDAQALISTMQSHIQSLNVSTIQRRMSSNGQELLHRLKEASEAFNEHHCLDGSPSTVASTSCLDESEERDEEGMTLLKASLPEFISRIRDAASPSGITGDRLWQMCQNFSNDAFLGKAFRLRLNRTSSLRACGRNDNYLDVAEHYEEDSGQGLECSPTRLSAEGAWWLLVRSARTSSDGAHNDDGEERLGNRGSSTTYRLRLVGPPGSRHVGRYLGFCCEPSSLDAQAVLVDRVGRCCGRGASSPPGLVAEWLLKRPGAAARRTSGARDPASRRELVAGASADDSGEKVMRKIASSDMEGPFQLQLAGPEDSQYIGGTLNAGRVRTRVRVKQALHLEKNKQAFFTNCVFVSDNNRSHQFHGHVGEEPSWMLEVVDQYA